MAGRLFTFGCSFTKNIWPTWADLLLQQMPGENWGQGGAGNKFIFESLIECHVTNRIDKDDTVIIMWSSWHREDRYINGWACCGNVYNAEPLYDKAFIKKYWDDRGALLETHNWMVAALQFLEGVGCKYAITFLQFDPTIGIPTESVELLADVDLTVFDKYKTFVNDYKHKIIEQNLWNWSNSFNDIPRISWNVPWVQGPWIDNHPTPLVFGRWIKSHLIGFLPNLDLIRLNHDAETFEAMLHSMAPTYPVRTQFSKYLKDGVNRV